MLAQEYELMAVKLSAFCDDLSAALKCLCPIPPGAVAFNFNGTMNDVGSECPTTGDITLSPINAILHVPSGMTGVITGIGVHERYPGSLYGSTFTLLVNQAAIPQVPRISHTLGTINRPLDVHVELPENALVSMDLTTTLYPYRDPAAGSNQFLNVAYPFSVSGYFQKIVSPPVTSQARPATTALPTQSQPTGLPLLTEAWQALQTLKPKGQPANIKANLLTDPNSAPKLFRIFTGGGYFVDVQEGQTFKIPEGFPTAPAGLYQIDSQGRSYKID